MVSSAAAVQAGPPILPRHGACLMCRKRKQRCDGAKPECQECIAANRKCQYEDDTYRTRTQQLQDRIRELEAQICAVEAARDAGLSSVSPLPSTSGGSQTHSGSNESSGISSSASHVSPSTSTPSPRNSLFSDPASWSPTVASHGSEPDLSNPLQFGLSHSEIKSLLDIFSTRYSLCGFELDLARVIKTFHSNAAEPVIPALGNAMLLMACHFTQDPGLKFRESILMERTKHEIENNIDRAHGIGEGIYNSLHHLQAMVLFGIYYYFKGRLLEGHVHITQAAGFAVALGVNQLNSRIFRQDVTPKGAKRGFSIERWHPRDSTELGEAINLWWTCSIWDLGGSTINGLPIAVPFEEVTTVWPRPLSDFELGYTLPDDDYSTASLLDTELSYIVADTSGDSIQTLLAKAGVLMQCAARLDTERVICPQGTEEWWAMFERCDQSLNRFMQTMPPVRLAQNTGELAFYVLIHTAIYCGQVQLHSVPAEYELALGAQGDPRCLHPDGTIGGISYTICTEACRAASLASTFVLGMDSSYMHMFGGIAWVCVSEVVARDVPWLRRFGRIAEAEEKERQGEVMERCMRKLVATYPVLGLQVEQMRAKKKEQLLRAGPN